MQRTSPRQGDPMTTSLSLRHKFLNFARYLLLLPIALLAIAAAIMSDGLTCILEIWEPYSPRSSKHPTVPASSSLTCISGSGRPSVSITGTAVGLPEPSEQNQTWSGSTCSNQTRTGVQ